MKFDGFPPLGCSPGERKTKQAYNLKGMGHDPNSHQLLAIVPTVHHERIRQSFNNRALSLAETLDGIAAGRVGNVDGRPDLNVVAIL